MDEILIEEKKYVSSKRAAKITGYAKDYIGQLCREGRVPARLVGRGWYVLESAIADHRFGNPGESKNTEKIEETVPTISKTWEFPRYEAAPTEILPSINRLHEREMTPVITEEDENDDEVEEEVAVEANQDVHDSWREWFDHVAGIESANSIEAPSASIETRVARAVSVPEEVKKVEESSTDSENPQVNVPLRVVSTYFPTKELALDPTKKETSKKVGHGLVTKIAFVIMGFATLISVSLACVGSGYLDKYLISNSQAYILLGITVYNK
jgi:hypothetical protein